MAQQKIKDYKRRYQFQRWWYSEGGKELVENAAGTIGIGLLIYEMWWLAYLLEP